MGPGLERVIGIDLGTAGLRALVVDLAGQVLAATEVRLRGTGVPDSEGRHEQDALEWRQALERAVGEVLCATPSRHLVRALACCGTSGTIVALDRRGEPRGPALLYNDRSAEEFVSRCTEALGQPVGWSFGLPRMVMLAERLGSREELRFAHAVDVLHEWLVGEPVATDFTSALKSGWSSETRSWSPALFHRLGLSGEQVPRVVSPGTVLGTVRRDLAERWGLSPSVIVVAGSTDANASFHACGAREPGAWNSALGSTLAVRGVAWRKVQDGQARVYNHLHPDGGWLVAGASNVGVPGVACAVDQAVTVRGTATGPRGRMDSPGGGGAGEVVPGEALCYPLAGRGERLPFVSPEAHAFWTASPGSAEEARAAARCSLALVERWIYEILETLEAPARVCVHATGGSARDAEWMRIRAGVLGCPVLRVRYPDSAFGAAIVAAASLQRLPVADAAARMSHVDLVVEPEPSITRWADEALPRLQAAVRARGWLEDASR